MEIVWLTLTVLTVGVGAAGLATGIFFWAKAAREPHPLELLLASIPQPPPMPSAVAAYMAAHRAQHDPSLPRPNFIPPPTVH